MRLGRTRRPHEFEPAVGQLQFPTASNSFISLPWSKTAFAPIKLVRRQRRGIPLITFTQL
jgi:hypothetical protein